MRARSIAAPTAACCRARAPVVVALLAGRRAAPRERCHAPSVAASSIEATVEHRDLERASAVARASSQRAAASTAPATDARGRRRRRPSAPARSHDRVERDQRDDVARHDVVQQRELHETDHADCGEDRDRRDAAERHQAISATENAEIAGRARVGGESAGSAKTSSRTAARTASPGSVRSSYQPANRETTLPRVRQRRACALGLLHRDPEVDEADDRSRLRLEAHDEPHGHGVALARRAAAQGADRLARQPEVDPRAALAAAELDVLVEPRRGLAGGRRDGERRAAATSSSWCAPGPGRARSPRPRSPRHTAPGPERGGLLPQLGRALEGAQGGPRVRGCLRGEEGWRSGTRRSCRAARTGRRSTRCGESVLRLSRISWRAR